MSTAHLVAAINELYETTPDEQTIAEWFEVRGIPKEEATLVVDVLIRSSASMNGHDMGSFLAGIGLVGIQIGWMAHASSMGELEEAA